MPKAPIRPLSSGFPLVIHQFEENDRNEYTWVTQPLERAVRRSTKKPTPDPTGLPAQAEPLLLVQPRVSAEAGLPEAAANRTD